MRRLWSSMLAMCAWAGAALADPPAQGVVAAIPEPEALALFLLGASVAGVAMRRNKR
jgi:hypothetical protein